MHDFCADAIEVEAEQGRGDPQPRGGEGCFAAGMTAADNDQLKGFGGQRCWLHTVIIGTGLEALGGLLWGLGVQLELKWFESEGCGIGHRVGWSLRRHALNVGRWW